MGFYTKNKEGVLVEIPMEKVETLLNNDVKVYSDKDLISELTLQKERLQEQNKILREALEFYANGIVQKDDYSEHKSVSTFSFTGLNRKNSGYGETEFVEQRFGKRAREALAKVDKQLPSSEDTI